MPEPLSAQDPYIALNQLKGGIVALLSQLHYAVFSPLSTNPPVSNPYPFLAVSVPLTHRLIHDNSRRHRRIEGIYSALYRQGDYPVAALAHKADPIRPLRTLNYADRPRVSARCRLSVHRGAEYPYALFLRYCTVWAMFVSFATGIYSIAPAL